MTGEKGLGRVRVRERRALWSLMREDALAGDDPPTPTLALESHVSRTQACQSAICQSIPRRLSSALGNASLDARQGPRSPLKDRLLCTADLPQGDKEQSSLLRRAAARCH